MTNIKKVYVLVRVYEINRIGISVFKYLKNAKEHNKKLYSNKGIIELRIIRDSNQI